jgi:bifunctional ADP-heptose synthase (sugar kinase/adenylyltransferase)
MPTTISHARLSHLLARARGKRIAVIGDAMLDVYLSGEVERISPEAPVPVVRVRGRKHALGGAANVAQNVAALGAQCDLVAAVDDDHSGAVPATLQRLGVEHILLTLGAEGMALFTADGEIARVPTVAREVYDVVGAGDTVTAYLACMLAAGATPSEAAVVANIAAGIEVGKLGAATVSGEEVLEAYDLWKAENGGA